MNERNIRRLDLTLSLVFRELVRERRTTEVAKHLGLSQSAVSHALARLRVILGDPLYIRRTAWSQVTNLKPFERHYSGATPRS